VVWKQVEEVLETSHITHPSVRACLEYLNIQRGVEIHHQGSLPARSGLGSSSAFTVGLLSSLYALRQQMSSKKHLACEAIHVEREILKENVGIQDQIAVSYGGLNKITINNDGSFVVDPVIISKERKKELESHCLLFFTGISRTASQIAGKKIKSLHKHAANLHEMSKMVDEGINIISGNRDIKDFGRLLHESWLMKRQITSEISNEVIDEIYSKAMAAGAIGGKLLGAGGGGFMLLFVDAEKKGEVLEALEDFLLVPIEFENDGSRIIYYDAENYSHTSIMRRDYIHLEQDN